MRSGEKDAGRGRRQKRARERERETEGERGAALAVHITLLTIRGQCHRVRPAAPLHFTWLHLAPPSRFSPACALRLLVLPPSRRVAPPSSHTRPLLSLSLSRPPLHSSDPSLLSRSTRAREIGLPRPASSLPQPCPFLPLPSIRSRFLSFSIGDFFRAPRPHPPLPLPSSRSSSAFSSCSCSLFLLVRPHRAFSSTVRVREHREAPHRRIVSSRLPRLVRSFRFFSLPSSSSSSSSLFLSFCLLSFRRLFLLRSPVVFPPPSLSLSFAISLTILLPVRARARGAV